MSKSHGVRLDSGKPRVARILPIPHENLLALISNETVRIYKRDTNGKAFFVFKKHQSPVVSLLGVDGQIVASLDSEGTIFTWKAYCGTIIDTIKVGMEQGGKARLAKLNSVAMGILFVDETPKIIAHTSGRNLQLSKHFIQEFDHVFSTICLLNDDLIAVASMRSIQVYNKEAKLLSTHLQPAPVVRMTANNSFLVVACMDGKLYLRKNGVNYPVTKTIDLNELSVCNIKGCRIRQLSFISDEVLLIAHINGILFFSFSTMALVDSIEPDEARKLLSCAAIFGESRICIGQNKSYYLYELPEAVRIHLREIRGQGHQASVSKKREKVKSEHGPVENNTVPSTSSTADKLESSSTYPPVDGDAIMTQVAKRPRRSEADDKFEGNDSARAKSKTRAPGADGQIPGIGNNSGEKNSQMLDLNALLLTQKGILDAAKSELENENDELEMVTRKLEEEKGQLKKLKSAGEKQDAGLVELGRKLEELKELKAALKKELKSLDADGIEGEETGDGVMTRYKTEIAELENAVEQLLFKSKAAGI